MIRPRRQIHLTHRRPHQALTFILQLAKLTYLPHAHIGVADNIGLRIGKTILLSIPCGLHARADGFAGFTDSISAELFIIHTRDFGAAAPCQFYRAVDPIFVFGIWSPAQLLTCMIFVNRRSSRTGVAGYTT